MGEIELTFVIQINASLQSDLINEVTQTQSHFMENSQKIPGIL
jgi:hypothetical protein